MLRRILLPIVMLAAGNTSLLAAQQIPQWVDQILGALDLPVSTAEARTEGAPADEVRQVVQVMASENVPAHEARRIIDEERTDRREHGPVDNFGAFVQSKLRAGLRGQELAAAIRAEHAAHGKGKGASKGKPGGPDDRAAHQPSGKDKKPDDRAAHQPMGNERKPDNRGKPTDRPAQPR